MPTSELTNKLVAILGFGQEGQSTAEYLLKAGIRPVLFDQRPWGDWAKEDQEKIKNLGVNFIFGPDAFLELKGFDVAFRSPGIKLSDPHLQARIKDKKSKLVITSQTKWFFDHCPAKIIGVTGTKGKGTTASLIYRILSSSLRVHPKQSQTIKGLSHPSDTFEVRNDKRSVYLTGNIGKIQPFEILDTLSELDWVVYELSSFQLQDLTKSPQIGVVLMVTKEHLDYHKNLNEYHSAKNAITKFQTVDDTAVINADYPASKKIGNLGKGQKIYVSRFQPVKPGCFVKQGEIFYCAPKSKPEKILQLSKLKLLGEHNWENVCAAVAAAKAAGCGQKAIVKALTTFSGLPNRLELVAEKNGIKFYNDSFSTTPETTIAAVEAIKEPKILILGGSSKKSDFKALATTINNDKNIRGLILIGQEALNIKNALGKKSSIPIQEGATNMTEIFKQIKTFARPGDTVLLSPACASFGMFKNYNDRGSQFAQAAKNWN